MHRLTELINTGSEKPAAEVIAPGCEIPAFRANLHGSGCPEAYHTSIGIL